MDLTVTHGRERMSRALSIVFICVGAVALLIALASLIWSVTWLTRTVAAEGLVTGYVSSGDPGTNQRISHFPVVTFVAADGRKIEFQSSMGAGRQAYRHGETVRVRYHPDAPERADLSTFMSLWIAPVLFGAMGLMFTLAGVTRRTRWSVRAN